jgi:hypothetical protein
LHDGDCSLLVSIGAAKTQFTVESKSGTILGRHLNTTYVQKGKLFTVCETISYDCILTPVASELDDLLEEANNLEAHLQFKSYLKTKEATPLLAVGPWLRHLQLQSTMMTLCQLGGLSLSPCSSSAMERIARCTSASSAFLAATLNTTRALQGVPVLLLTSHDTSPGVVRVCLVVLSLDWSTSLSMTELDFQLDTMEDVKALIAKLISQL